MRIKHTAPSVLGRATGWLFTLFVLVATPAKAQLTVFPATGCQDAVVGGGAIYSVGDQSPTLGNLTFALQHVCPVGSNAAFFIFGTCQVTPGVDWDLQNSCFGSWVTPPASCGRAYDTLTFLSGGLTRQGGKVTLALPVPNLPALVTLTQSQPLCFQFVCVDLDAANPCMGVSQGAQLIFQ